MARAGAGTPLLWASALHLLIDTVRSRFRITPQGNGPLKIDCFYRAGVTNSLLSSTNFASWIAIAKKVSDTNGVCESLDTPSLPQLVCQVSIAAASRQNTIQHATKFTKNAGIRKNVMRSRGASSVRVNVTTAIMS